MFSSQKDMEGALELFLVMIVLCAVLYLLGFRLPQGVGEAVSGVFSGQFFRQGSMFLLIPLGLNVILLLGLRLIYRGKQ
jgi:hypothetical protein